MEESRFWLGRWGKAIFSIYIAINSQNDSEKTKSQHVTLLALVPCCTKSGSANPGEPWVCALYNF